MDSSFTADGHGTIVLSAEETTTLLVEALATREGILEGAVRARLSVSRSETDGGQLIFRLAVRPAPPAERLDDLAEETSAPSTPAAESEADPTADPAPDAFSAGTEL